MGTGLLGVNAQILAHIENRLKLPAGFAWPAAVSSEGQVMADSGTANGNTTSVIGVSKPETIEKPCLWLFISSLFEGAVNVV